MIEIRHLFKSFGKQQVLKDINLTISRGKIVAVLGPNGSGKTTLIKSLLGLVLPQKGDVFFNGKAIAKRWDYRRSIAYMSQIARFPENLRVHELIRMIKDVRQQEAQDTYLIELFGLNDSLNKFLRNLSGGTRQKVNIVLTFMFDTPAIILDEPIAGLDPVAITGLKKLINTERERGKTILYTTHIMSLVEEISDEIVFLLEGQVYFKGSVHKITQLNGAGNLEKAIASLITQNHV